MESRIRQLRRQHHITQQALGDAMGLSQQIISRMERDRSKIQVDVLLSLADYFQVSTDEVLGYERGKKSPVRPAAEAFRLRSAAAGDVDMIAVVEHLEKMDYHDRMALWQLLAMVKRYL